jgi:hypothetical protein
MGAELTKAERNYVDTLAVLTIVHQRCPIETIPNGVLLLGVGIDAERLDRAIDVAYQDTVRGELDRSAAIPSVTNVWLKQTQLVKADIDRDKTAGCMRWFRVLDKTGTAKLK